MLANHNLHPCIVFNSVSVFFIVLFILGDDVERGDQLEQQGAAHYHDEQQLRRAQGERLQEV